MYRYFLFFVLFQLSSCVEEMDEEPLSQHEEVQTDKAEESDIVIVDVDTTFEDMKTKAMEAQDPTRHQLEHAWTKFQNMILHPEGEIDWFKLGIDYQTDWLYIVDSLLVFG